MAKSSEPAKTAKADRKPSHSKDGKLKDGIYKRGKIYYIQVMIDGKLVRKSSGSSYKAQAEAMLAELKSHRAISKVTGSTSGLRTLLKKVERKRFAELAKAYLDERPTLKESSKRSYQDCLNHLLPVFGELYLDQINEEKIAQFQAHLHTIKKLSAKRINNIMGPLRFVLKVGVRRKLIADNPALNVPPLKEKAPDIDPLTYTELEQVLEALKPYQRPLFTTLAWTGARPDELFALRWADVNFKLNEINISKGRVYGKESTPKTSSGIRAIPMFSIVKKTLLALQKSATQHVEGYVFLNKKGQPFDKHVDREWRTALVKAKVKHRPSYQLRHTFASLCLQQGAEASWVSKLLGHSSLQVTFKHYARYIDDKSGRNEAKLEQFLTNQEKPQGIHSFVHSLDKSTKNKV